MSTNMFSYLRRCARPGLARPSSGGWRVAEAGFRALGADAHHDLGVLLRHAALLVDLHHLLDLALLVILQLPRLALALLHDAVVLGLGGERVAHAHGESVREHVRKAEDENDVRAKPAAGGAGDDGEGRDDAVQPAVHHGLDPVARLVVALGRVQQPVVRRFGRRDVAALVRLFRGAEVTGDAAAASGLGGDLVHWEGGGGAEPQVDAWCKDLCSHFGENSHGPPQNSDHLGFSPVATAPGGDKKLSRALVWLQRVKGKLKFQKPKPVRRVDSEGSIQV